MRSGKMGVVVIMIAIVATLGVSWVMSMDVTETDVTKYRPLADISGEFQTGQTPQFVEYNPSTNYTGYYTDNSIINETRYFDGVEFTPSERANNFRVQERPTSQVITDNYDLDSLTNTGTIMVSYFNQNTQNVYQYIGVPQAKYATITDLLTQISEPSSNFTFTISATDQPSDLSDLSQYIAIYTPSMVDGSVGLHGVWLKNPALTGTLRQSGPTLGSDYVVDAQDVSNPILAAVWDGVTVQLYYDVARTQSAGIYPPDQVSIAWGGSSSTTLSSLADVEYLGLPAPVYMDPSQGVEL